MDPTQETTLEEMLAKLQDTITISSPSLEHYSDARGWSDPQYGAVPSLTTDQISKLTINGIDANINGTTYSNISLNGGGYTIGTGINTSGHVWTTTGTGTSPYTITSPYQSAKIQLNGKDADIEVNGESLMTMLHRIEKRLNLLTPNTKLEEEWEELRELGEQYRRLEQHIKDKQATWDRLKAMPPPVVE
jgi:hypothetical protein